MDMLQIGNVSSTNKNRLYASVFVAWVFLGEYAVGLCGSTETKNR